jgi:hypothetical protein
MSLVGRRMMLQARGQYTVVLDGAAGKDTGQRLPSNMPGVACFCRLFH